MKRLIPALIASSNFPVYSQMSVSPHLNFSFWVFGGGWFGFLGGESDTDSYRQINSPGKYPACFALAVKAKARKTVSACHQFY